MKTCPYYKCVIKYGHLYIVFILRNYYKAMASIAYNRTSMRLYVSSIFKYVTVPLWAKDVMDTH